MDVAQKLHFDADDIEDEELNISCRTGSSGCDVEDVLDSSADDFTPSVFPQPRKLSFSDAMECSDSENNRDHDNNEMPHVIVTG